MNTAVQLRAAGHAPSSAPRCELIYGDALGVIAGRSGPIALFPPHQVVAYALRVQRSRSGFVFRTLDTDDAMAARVPGVHPHVRLLVHLRSAGRTRLLGGFFAHLLAQQQDPSALPDAAWFRIGAVLAGRLPAARLLNSLVPSLPAQP